MNFERMQEIQEDLFVRIREIRETKGREYATDQDTLADFKEVAEEVGSTPLKTWATYCKKHQRAVDTFVREGGVKSESIESRILDVVTYHILLLGLIEDLESSSRGDQPMGIALNDAKPGESVRVLTQLPSESDEDYARRLRPDDPDSLRIQLQGRVEGNLQERSALMGSGARVVDTRGSEQDLK